MSSCRGGDRGNQTVSPLRQCLPLQNPRLRTKHRLPTAKVSEKPREVMATDGSRGNRRESVSGSIEGESVIRTLQVNPHESAWKLLN